jgi:hypothetical protein
MAFNFEVFFFIGEIVSKNSKVKFVCDGKFLYYSKSENIDFFRDKFLLYFLFSLILLDDYMFHNNNLIIRVENICFKIIKFYS